ncbi:MAG: ABC transporter ATP-binding protein [Ruminiclostridium sp.]|nr:ABC transporter ATP-binding protein [Ruminiclostridium sp.]
MDIVLQLDHVSKVYSNGRGARNIDFSVERGEVVGLLGPNGSGKTTIMKAVCGLSQPTEGTVTVFGSNVVQDREAALAKVGALIEQPALFENLTAWDNLRLAARYYPNVDAARMEKILGLVGLTPYRKEKCGKFSLGMKQRMGLALALLSEPELVILDEPTNGLDIEATVEIREIIIRLAREKGVTFLVASHLAGEIEKMCSKVLVLHEGEMLAFDTREEALRLHPSLEDYFLAKVRDKKGSVVL